MPLKMNWLVGWLDNTLALLGIDFSDPNILGRLGVINSRSLLPPGERKNISVCLSVFLPGKTIMPPNDFGKLLTILRFD
jgi:hypothetical protein